MYLKCIFFNHMFHRYGFNGFINKKTFVLCFCSLNRCFKHSSTEYHMHNAYSSQPIHYSLFSTTSKCTSIINLYYQLAMLKLIHQTQFRCQLKNYACEIKSRYVKNNLWKKLRHCFVTVRLFHTYFYNATNRTNQRKTKLSYYINKHKSNELLVTPISINNIYFIT